LAEVGADPAVAVALALVPVGAEVAEPGRGAGDEVPNDDEDGPADSARVGDRAGDLLAGFIRNTVTSNVNFNGNVTFDPDGNEVVTNSVGRNLNCTGNSPAPQVSYSEGTHNTIGGKATGQCVGLT
jgi:hypothetical protein